MANQIEPSVDYKLEVADRLMAEYNSLSWILKQHLDTKGKRHFDNNKKILSEKLRNGILGKKDGISLEEMKDALAYIHGLAAYKQGELNLKSNLRGTGNISQGIYSCIVERPKDRSREDLLERMAEFEGAVCDYDNETKDLHEIVNAQTKTIINNQYEIDALNRAKRNRKWYALGAAVFALGASAGLYFGFLKPQVNVSAFGENVPANAPYVHKETGTEVLHGSSRYGTRHNVAVTNPKAEAEPIEIEIIPAPVAPPKNNKSEAPKAEDSVKEKSPAKTENSEGNVDFGGLKRATQATPQQSGKTAGE